ncbi:MAG: hypothetical protein WDW38_001814 [Sanguina aurantia]
MITALTPQRKRISALHHQPAPRQAPLTQHRPLTAQVPSAAITAVLAENAHLRSELSYIPDEHPMRMVACVNDVYSARASRWNDLMNNKTDTMRGAVRALGAWWSDQPSTTPVTVVTQASLDRLPQLHAQCQSWEGPLSAVVYLGILQRATHRPNQLNPDGTLAAATQYTGSSSYFSASVPANMLSMRNRGLLERAVAHCASLARQAEAMTQGCKLDLLLVYEVFSEERALMLYPFNVLRNLARMQARTPVIALLDVDMLASRTLYTWLAEPTGKNAADVITQCAAKSVFVITAFEPEPNPNITTYDMAAQADLQVGRIRGHNWTLYDKWRVANEIYPITPGAGYEPWLMMDRFSPPWFDVRFRGYGSDKVVHINSLNASSFDFKVLPSAFIIHRAHVQTTASSTFQAGFSHPYHLQHDGRDMSRHNHYMLADARLKMETSQYEATIDETVLRCADKLPWWDVAQQ